MIHKGWYAIKLRKQENIFNKIIMENIYFEICYFIKYIKEFV